MRLSYQKVLKDVETLASKEEKLSLLDKYAEVLYERERYLEAMELYRKALEYEARPNMSAYMNGQIGICYYHLQDDAKAEVYLVKAHKLFDPGKPNFMADAYTIVNFYLGSLYEYQGKSSKALQVRKECLAYIESQPKETQLLLFSGISRNYQDLGKKADALQFYQRALAALRGQDPGLISLYESIALNHFELGQHAEALQNFQKILELDPNFERRDEIYGYIAECYHRLTNYRQALETYLHLLELREITDGKRDVAPVLSEIAHCYLRLKEHDTSIHYCQRALREKITDKKRRAEVHAYLADNYYELQRYPEATTAGKQALKLAKAFRHSDILIRDMALSYYKLGDFKNFRKFRDRYHKAYPEDRWNQYLDSLTPPKEA